jgi:hypothetical protein
LSSCFIDLNASIALGEVGLVASETLLKMLAD